MGRIADWLGRWGQARRAAHITAEAARQRAARGAAYLDEVDPGWHRLVDADALDLGSRHACVLGQRYGGFRPGLARAGLINLGSAPRASLSPVRYGFLCVQGVPARLQEQDYRFLDEAWAEEVHRRAGDGEPEEAHRPGLAAMPAALEPA